MMQEIVWATAVVVLAVLAHDGFKRWIAREPAHVRELKTELKATQGDWEKRFTRYEQAHDQLVTRFNATNPSPNPLGKHYSTQRPG